MKKVAVLLAPGFEVRRDGGGNARIPLLPLNYVPHRAIIPAQTVIPGLR